MVWQTALGTTEPSRDLFKQATFFAGKQWVPGGVRQVQVRLVGVDSNRDGLGARVTVHAAGKRYVQVHDGQSGYLSQSRMPLYFGLGAAEAVEKRVSSGDLSLHGVLGALDAALVEAKNDDRRVLLVFGATW